MQRTVHATPEEYLASLPEDRRANLQALLDLVLEEYPDEKPYMISGMIGVGSYHYKYDSGKEGDWFKVGLFDRKAGPSVYVCAVDDDGYVMEKHADLFPKGSVGRSCLRFKKNEDIDMDKLRQVLKAAKKAKFGM